MSDRWKSPRNIKIKGLGDAVELLAQPIAKAIDAVFNTHVQGCSSCQKRKAELNELVPFDNSMKPD